MAHIRKTLVPLVLVAALTGALSACEDSKSDRSTNEAQSTVSASQEADEDTKVEEPFEDLPAEQDDSTISVPVDGTAKWSNGVTASLANFTRGITGESALEANVRYLAFTVKVHNGSKDTLDLNGLTTQCPTGSEEIYDSERGFEGSPSSHLLPGKDASWSMACEFGQEETELQVEITPFDSGDGWYRTAIFHGKVR